VDYSSFNGLITPQWFINPLKDYSSLNGLFIPQWFVTHEPSLFTHPCELRWLVQYTATVFCEPQTTEVEPPCTAIRTPLRGLGGVWAGFIPPKYPDLENVYSS
jgi:hypothetical protein